MQVLLGVEPQTKMCRCKTQFQAGVEERHMSLLLLMLDGVENPLQVSLLALEMDGEVQ